jgi:glycosyltransferase involved in cell wall biosynthesis
VIVVDDGSSDKTAEIVQSFSDVRYIYQVNHGVAVARNTGIASARGEFVAFLDQDDLWTPEKLRVQMDYLLKNPDVGYVIARQSIFLESGTAPPSWLKNDILLHDQTGFLPGTLLIRKSVFKQIGIFDSVYNNVSDAEFFFRAKDAGVRMKMLPDVLLKKRIHKHNQSYNVKALHLEYLNVARVSIKRQQSGKK